MLCNLSFSIANSKNITIYVDDDNKGGPWDGSIEHPLQYIQDAIDVSSCDDVIVVFNVSLEYKDFSTKSFGSIKILHE